MTPAVTPASTASEKRRRSSTRSLALQDLVALRFQLQQHLVERVAERGDVAVGGAHRHRDVEIAGRHLVGRADQLADRPHQPVGDGNAGPDRRQHDDQRQAEIEQREGDLRRAAVRLEAAILVGVGGHDLARPDDFRVDQPDRVEIGVLDLAQLDDRADDVARCAARSAPAGRRRPSAPLRAAARGMSKSGAGLARS